MAAFVEICFKSNYAICYCSILATISRVSKLEAPSSALRSDPQSVCAHKCAVYCLYTVSVLRPLERKKKGTKVAPLSLLNTTVGYADRQSTEEGQCIRESPLALAMHSNPI